MLYYITSNDEKVKVANQLLEKQGLQVEGRGMELRELQSDDITEVAVEKAKHAFSEIGEPLFVNDAGWYITALNGFPGAYMKFINQWLTAEDILKLMDGKQNREVIFREVIVYIDKEHTQTFTNDIKGVLLDKDTSPSDIPSASLISLHPKGYSIAECWKKGVLSFDNHSIWEKFAKWYNTTIVN